LAPAISKTPALTAATSAVRKRFAESRRPHGRIAARNGPEPAGSFHLRPNVRLTDFVPECVVDSLSHLLEAVSMDIL